MNDERSRATEPAPPRWMRRALLGGGVVVAAAAAAGAWRAVATGMVLQGDEAFEPWAAWRTAPAGDPLSLVAAAVLASSPHNTQPWVFRVQPDRIDVFADGTRGLGAMDPFAREMWHGLGAAVANLEVAAPARGFATQTLWRPDPADAALAARVLLRPAAAAAAPLAASIDQRRTNRAPYDAARAVPDAVRHSLQALDDDTVRLRWLPADSAPGRAFADATIEATRQINADAEMAEAGHRWFRADPKAVARHRDGVSTPTAGISPLLAALAPLGPPLDSGAAGEYWLRSTREQLASAPLYGLVMVRDLYDRRSQLLAGARWQRLHLQLTAQGLAAHPLNQLMEIVDRDRQLARASPTAALLAGWVGEAGWYPTFAFRTGYATRAVPHSARRGLAAVMAPPPAG